jgi:hypothetical protein
MNIRDEIRDEIYGSQEDSAEVEAIATEYSQWTDKADLPYGAQKLFALALAADAALFILTLFGLGYVRYLLNSVQVFAFGLIAAFVIGFFIAFSAYKIFKNDIQTDTEIHIDSGVMSGYSDYEAREREFTVWFLSAGGGVLNAIVWLGVLMTRP